MDFVIEWRGRLLPIEVKAARTLGHGDTKPLRIFLEEYPDQAAGGSSSTTAPSTYWAAKNVLAVPWGRVVWGFLEKPLRKVLTSQPYQITVQDETTRTRSCSSGLLEECVSQASQNTAGTSPRASVRRLRASLRRGSAVVCPSAS